MSYILSQTMDVNLAPFQERNLMRDQVFKFINKKKGSKIENQNMEYQFYLYANIGQVKSKKIVLTFQQKKHSFTIQFITEINPDSIMGADQKINQTIAQFNQNIVDERRYNFQKPNEFAMWYRIQKSFLQSLYDPQRRVYIQKLLESLNNDFVECVAKLLSFCSKQPPNSNSNINLGQYAAMIKNLKQLFTKWSKSQGEYKEKKFKFSNTYGINMVVKEQKMIQELLQKDRENLCASFRNSKSINKSKKKSQKPIVQKIKIMQQSVDKSWKAPSSNGVLEKIKAQFIAYVSFNLAGQESLSENSSDLSETNVRNKNYLVRKTFKVQNTCAFGGDCQNAQCSSYRSKRSYQNEVRILSYIRNMINSSVALYFLEGQGGQLETQSKIYSKFYPNNFSNRQNEQRLTIKEIFPFILKFLQGLIRFHGSNIIHRDLKLDNILLDNKMTPKIIDFGSAWLTKSDCGYQKKLCQQLYTTKGYNLFYEQAFFKQKQKMSLNDFERHQLYDMYAFGVILQKLLTKQINSQLGPIAGNLRWLSDICKSHNPDLRPEPEEAHYFCQLLQKYWLIKSKTLYK